MGINSQVLTQNSLLALNAALEQLASNLNIHVNESLSIAHGINASIADYYDNMGDKWGNVVIAFEFGAPPNVTRLYVPAQITTLGPASTGTGIVASPAPSGSFSSPGVPLSDKPLVTDLTSESTTQAVIHDEMLLAHANTVHSDAGANQCHGGTTYASVSVLDSLGHIVGRRYVTIGVNDTSWSIPCDPFVDGANYGPPQTPRLTQFSQTYFRFNSSSPNTAMSGTPITVVWAGTMPGVVKWRMSHDNVLWTDLGVAPYNAPPYSTGGSYVGFPGWQSGVAYTLTDTYSTQDTMIVKQMHPDENAWRSLYLKAVVENAGGTATTQTIQIDIYDETGSWIVYAAHAVRPFSTDEMKRLYKLRIWSRKNRREHALFYLGAEGKELVSKMRARGFDFGTLTDEIRGFLADGLDGENRFNLFRKMVVRCLREYWPSCPHPVAVAELSQ